MRFLLVVLSIVALTMVSANFSMVNANTSTNFKPAIVADENFTLIDGIDWDEWLTIEGIDWDEWLTIDGIDWDEWLLGIFFPTPPPAPMPT